MPHPLLPLLASWPAQAPALSFLPCQSLVWAQRLLGLLFNFLPCPPQLAQQLLLLLYLLVLQLPSAFQDLVVGGVCSSFPLPLKPLLLPSQPLVLRQWQRQSRPLSLH